MHDSTSIPDQQQTTVLLDTKGPDTNGILNNGVKPIQQDHESAPDSRVSFSTEEERRDPRPPFGRTQSRTWPSTPPLNTNGARAAPFQHSDYTETPHTPYFWQHTKPRESTSKRFPRISRPVELLRNKYDVVVIGSGYGGGVAASRMARGRQRVCVLERGKERWPGEYPTKMEDALKQLHVTGRATPWNSPVGKLVQDGDPTGLYHLMLGDGQNVFVGNGLGGTSLLNANVFLKADDGAMSLESWPPELREPGTLDTYYKRAADMLEPKRYPRSSPPLSKLSMLERQARKLGYEEDFSRVKQTTRFEDGPNWAGIQMSASTGSGQDCTGVNDGSKSSTLVNYLSDAWNWGAEIFCECEVRHIRKHPKKGYLVFFAWHGAGRGAFAGNIYDDLMWVYAKKLVFLGAGTLGTTEILLRSRQLGLETSARVGVGLSGNGDMLSFGYNMNDEVHAIGNELPDPTHPTGPTITGIIDRRKTDDPLDGYVIEEGAIPEALAPYFRAMLLATPGKRYVDYPRYYQKAAHFVATNATRLFRPFAHVGSIQKTQVYLVMSHDDNQATLKLKNDKPELIFRGVGRSDKVREVDNILAEATKMMGGTYINNPFYAAFGQQEISVHPIGGANMSSNGTGQTGVANHIGQVFKSKGSQVHDGLVVVDGSIIPTALGVNPFATITALAERSVEHIANAYDIKIDYETKNGILNILSTPPSYPVEQYENVDKAESMITKAVEARCAGFSFTEVMSGYIYEGDSIKDFDLACSTARGLCEGARFFLSVNSWNLAEMVASGDHEAMLTGSFACALPGSPFMINRGSFQLLNPYLRSSDTKHMTYDFDMTGVNGEKVHFHGYKVINSSVALNPWAYWKATTTLNVVLTTPQTRDGKNARLLGRGVLRINPSDFKSELFSMHSYGPGVLGKLRSASSFLQYFTRQSAGLFLTPFSFLQYPSQTWIRYNGLNISDHFHVYASDKVKSEMKMWNPPDFKPGHSARPPVILMIPGASSDHEVYALPTIEHNAIDYLRKGGYRIYTVTHRIGKNDENRSAKIKNGSGSPRGPSNYEARLDIEAAIREIRKREGSDDKIHVIAHCMGSVALGMGLMDGTIPAAWIKGITASQVFINPIWYIENKVKTWFPIGLDTVWKKAAGLWYSCNSSRNDSWLQQGINQALRFYPVGRREELCNSVCCHRCSFVFGRLWNHKNLNEATHGQLHRFFSGVNMTWLNHAMKFGVLGHITNDFDEDIATDKNIRKIKGIPILLFSGADNVVLDPESTMRSYDRLRKVNGPQGYRREVIEGYGHIDCWMGKSAYEHVYPMILDHIDQVFGRPGQV